MLAAELPETGPCVILNSPTEITSLYVEAVREPSGRIWPMPTYLLYVGIEPLMVERVGERSLELTSEVGWAGEQLDRFSRDWREGFAVGDLVTLEHATVTGLEVTDDGRPRRVRVELDRSLDEIGIYGFGRAGQPGLALEHWRPQLGERERFEAGLLPGL